MTSELKKTLGEIRGLIGNWNAGKIAKEEEFINDLRPLLEKAAEEVAKPQDRQATID